MLTLFLKWCWIGGTSDTPDFDARCVNAKPNNHLKSLYQKEGNYCRLLKRLEQQKRLHGFIRTA
jgi:hypothetical protein